MPATLSVEKRPIEVPNLKSCERTRERISMKIHGTESRFVIGSSNMLFGGVYVCNIQPGNFIGYDSEGVKQV